MIIANVVFLIFAASPSVDAYNSYHELSNQLADQVEWIDQRGARTISKQNAQKLLTKYAQGLSKQSFSVRHFSEWKNNKCFRILHLYAKNETHRIFFQCIKKEKSKNHIVTKIKISSL